MSRSPGRPAVAAACALACALACGLAWAPAAARAQAEAPHVQNAAKPAAGLQTLVMKEAWRAGGEQSDLIFGSIGTVLAGADGTIYVLDSQLSQVAIFAPDGKFVRTVGREGDGPGEVRRPGGMMLLPDGALGLIQTFPGKVVKVRPDGTPAGGFAAGSGDPSQGRFSVLVEGQSRGGAIVMAGMDMTIAPDGTSNQGHFLASCDAAGRRIQTYASADYVINYADLALDEKGLNFVYGRWGLGHDGRVYVPAERNRYLIRVFGPDGRLERTFGREYASWRRDAAATNVARQALEAVGRNYPTPPRRTTVEETEPDVAGIWIAPDGEAWVTSSRGIYEAPAGTRVVFDVFDAQGRFARQIALAGPGDTRRDALYMISPTRAVSVTGALDAFLAQQGVAGGDEEAPTLELICYSLEKK